MKFAKKHGCRALIIIAAGIFLITGCLEVSAVLTEPYAHITLDFPRTDIVQVLSREQLSEADYETLYYQTGLGKPAIDELRANSPDSTQSILRFQEKFFSSIKYVCEKNSPISKEESLVDKNGIYINGTEMASLHNGDVLVTKSSHTYGWRNGHAALVVSAAEGLTLESVVLGTDSCLQDISKWTNYPNFILLRLKNTSPELMNEIAQTALKNLNALPYDLTIGLLSPKFSKAGEISRTHCSHLVWQAFRLFGFDLDSDGGMIVTPKDIANSPNLEVVQVFGVNPKEPWP